MKVWALNVWFLYGRADIWHPEKDIYWGSEDEFLAPSENRYENLDDPSTLEQPLEQLIWV